MRMMLRSALAAFVVGCLAMPALAQSESDFVRAFSGDWQTLDPAFADGGACRVTLGRDAKGQGYSLSSAHCGGAMNDLESWRIVENQLGLVSRTGDVVARLGGNQNRISGDTADKLPVVFERLAAAAPAAAPADAAPVRTAQSCIYIGYTATCATPADLASPKETTEGANASAGVLVRLNARAEARPDAAIVATIPAGTCVQVDRCTTASDGLWCRAKVSTFEGWIRQRAVRDGRWPVLTFAAGCRS
ncbi:SH3 domain-containing protein [Aureimonas psammosilenae]|uniref:SH3 domain-containing protein n=1 Tax=Aureimonas psammosilenae TaxID=2495496 RepID=UPI00126130A5|nr:SH3 domain-containing protein [Aureimonas psammosilenae]